MSLHAFKAPRFLANRHTQSILASSSIRKLLHSHRYRQLRQQAKIQLIQTRDARLQLMVNEQKEAIANAILIHGWEGSSDSLYLQGCAHALFSAGFNVYRLNLRDHGDTHHLNPMLFNSVRLQEVLEACLQISQINTLDNCLGGFSLGGNFALRIAAKADAVGLELKQLMAICPLLNPNETMLTLENGWWVYHHYFLRKWQRSLNRKLRFYPELGYGETLLQQNSLRDMNNYFIPGFTDYESAKQYFDAYAITGDYLANINLPCDLVFADDDPIIDAKDIAALAPNPRLNIQRHPQGGHCGFIMNYRLQSWLEPRIVECFKSALT